MKEKRIQKDTARKIALIGLLTALAAALSFVKIPIIGASITLVLPVVVIGVALCGPIVGAWLTVIPNIVAIFDAGIFLINSPIGCVITMLLKGILTGLIAGLVYKAMAEKHPLGAVTCSAIVAPIINSGVFFLGCYLCIWDDLVALAGEKGVGIGMLVFGLVILNGTIELILNAILCPTILRMIQIVKKKRFS